MSKLSEGRKRFERTLSLETFAHEDNVSQIVKNHILKSPPAEDDFRKSDPQEQLEGMCADEFTKHWGSKVWAFLDEVRSASARVNGKSKPGPEAGCHSREWKLKDETERYRVMYREGPEGTPFHTLGMEGVIDGDFSSALCVAWESPLYNEWWPQFKIPTFKILESKWLQRVRVGHDLSLLRFKVPWPLAQREVLLSAFEVEHLQEDLVIGLVDSLPEAVEFNEKVYGFRAANLPPLSASVRMDVGGGFVLQRISKDHFFFRTILNMDLKLDFVPPWLINFISRQVAGQALKHYQKAVLAASHGTGRGKAFEKPLKSGLLYERIRLGLEANKGANGDAQPGQAS